MPEHCAAYCCANRRTIANRGRGITFHKFPKDKDMRKNFPVHLQRLEKGRTTSTSRKAEESLSVAPQDDPEASTSHSQPQPSDIFK
ncbi:hypothetical protein CesoFtcFv8_019508 [Champsocephalus esox]|uniref:THAP-type domain-containing protein n=1 Tax=Champsocephalus esox TaxID=159716 RepID=A0AAN8GM97_9TELE|nr:hypothetical protein CesoFtcFv8_019508 [Champsocephalus esox]